MWIEKEPQEVGTGKGVGAGCQEGGIHSGSALSTEAAGLTGMPHEGSEGAGNLMSVRFEGRNVGGGNQAARVKTLPSGILSSPQ